MFLSVYTIRLIWEMWRFDINIAGKIILFPLFFLFTATIALFGIAETVVIDPFLLLLVLFSKTLSVSDLFSEFWFE